MNVHAEPQSRGEGGDRCVEHASTDTAVLPAVSPEMASTPAALRASAALRETDEAPTCEGCGEELEECEIISPMSKDQQLCDECYREAFEFDCDVCQESRPNEERHEWLVVFEEVPCRWFDWRTFKAPTIPARQRRPNAIRPGIYRVVGRPYYWDTILDCGLFGAALEFIGLLPEYLQGGDGVGFACRSCQERLDMELRPDRHRIQRAMMTRAGRTANRRNGR